MLCGWSCSTCVIFLQCPQAFNLVHSFPLLEDLALSGYSLLGNDPHGQKTVIPSTPPVLRFRTRVLVVSRERLSVDDGAGDEAPIPLNISMSGVTRPVRPFWFRAGAVAYLPSVVDFFLTSSSSNTGSRVRFV